MAKYYAVKKGREPGIYESWDECKSQVDGYKNAIFKSFKSKEEALSFMEDNKKISVDEKNMTDDDFIAYVDGSYREDREEYSYGCVIFHGGEMEKYSKKFPKSSYSVHRNVSGEIAGSVFAIKKALEKNVKSISIFYDYQGIESWANGDWKTNTSLTKEYKKFIDQVKNDIEINFVKVKGHSDNTYNDMADGLAKKALGIK